MNSGNRAAGTRFAAAMLAAFAFACAPHAGAAEGIAWNGFVQSHVAARTSNVQCPAATECDLPVAELRGQLEAEGKIAAGNAGFVARFNLIGDAALGETRFETRELYADTSSEKLAARLGRQVVTWGVGDLLFINDTFPKDRVALFTGQPLQYLKLGSDALKLNAYPGPVNMEVLIAGFRPDNLPAKDRFVLADPLPPGLPRFTTEPGSRASELELSGRVSGYVDNWELASYASRTHYRSPAMRVTPGEIDGTFPRLNTLGGSLTGPVGKGVVSLEAGYYDSPSDRGGRDPSIDNSQFRGLVGYSRQPWEDATFGLQYYGEWMRDYGAYRETLPAGFPVKDRLRQVATFRLTQLFAHQTFTLNLFGFIGVSEKDRYFIPSLRYNVSDNLWTEIGANVFSGKRSGTYGALQDNSNVYMTVRYTF